MEIKITNDESLNVKNNSGNIILNVKNNGAVEEGNGTVASGDYSHAEGEGATTSGDKSHAEGYGTKAIGENSHAEGYAEWGEPYEVTIRPLTNLEKEEIAAKVGDVHPDYICEEDDIEDGQCPVLYTDEDCMEEVARIKWSKYSSVWHDNLRGDFFQIVNGTLSAGTYWARLEPAASGNNSHAEGYNTTASGSESHAEGDNTTAYGSQSHAEGERTTASGESSHTEGSGTAAEGDYSHAEGGYTIASGESSHAEGDNTTASGSQSHAEGEGTIASGYVSHAEGNYTKARGDQSHAEGDNTTASGVNSHAEGNNTTASGNDSHAEGSWTTASGNWSHAEGDSTIAAGENQHVSGKYNVEDNNDEYALIVGNGTSDNARSNAFAIDWSGNLNVWNNSTKVTLTPSKLSSLVNLQTITQAAYDALVQAGTVDPNTIYIIL